MTCMVCDNILNNNIKIYKKKQLLFVPEPTKNIQQKIQTQQQMPRQPQIQIQPQPQTQNTTTNANTTTTIDYIRK